MGLLSLFRRKPASDGAARALSPVTAAGAGWYRILESYAGAWQSNVTVDRDGVLTYQAVYACMTLIASDIAKLRIKLVQQISADVWEEVQRPAFSPVLRKPNHFQTRIQFIESWILSKLATGNAYVLKRRDARSVVTGLYVLDPRHVRVLVTDDGEVYYEIDADNVSGIGQKMTVPAREVIHDRFNTIFHPLIGVSPIVAAGVAATQGLAMQGNSANFFGNASIPGGVLSAPGHIGDDTALRLKTAWETKFSGENAGKIAVLGDGLKFDKIAMTAEEAQMIDQLRWTGEVICSVYHVPRYKVGIGDMPTYNNIQALNVEYYTQALQRLIEDIEACLDEGLGLGAGRRPLGTEFDTDNLLRMDAQTQMESLKTGTSAGILSPNEARAKIGLGPVIGGETPYLQQQNWALSDLADRKDQGVRPPSAAPMETDETERAVLALRMKYLEDHAHA